MYSEKLNIGIIIIILCLNELNHHNVYTAVHLYITYYYYTIPTQFKFWKMPVRFTEEIQNRFK